MMFLSSSHVLPVALAAVLLPSSVSSAAFVPRSAAFGSGTISRGTTASSTGSTTTTTSLDAISGNIYCQLKGVGSATPATIITNKDLENVVDTTDEWIFTRTGIAERHVLTGEEKLRDLSIQAAKNAMEMAGIGPEDLDLVICASSTPDDMFGDAPSIASALGCATTTVAFDLVAACSGFLFGAVTAGKFLAAPKTEIKRALVIGADSLSRWIDWDDRNTCILFGDGAGAVILETSDVVGLLSYAGHSNGGGYCDLNVGYSGEPRHVATPGDGTMVTTGSYRPLQMNGKEVYKFATREVPEALEKAIEAAGIEPSQIDWLLLHQANIRIMGVVANRLGIPMTKVITNLSKYGNTSAASIPIALDEAVRSGQVKPGDIIACAGFGAGLSWGAAIFRWG